MTLPNQSASKRRTIAVLGAQLSRSWGAEFMDGVLDSARASDINVVCFVGGRPMAIASPQHGGYSYGLYDLVKPGHFDGILLSADLSHGTKAEAIRDFCRIFSPTPLVSFAIPAEGIPSFIADNEGGMRAMIRHLIEMHGYKRIAFIRGMQGHLEADQRFNAYLEELKIHDIRFDERLVVDGDYTTESGRAAVRTLLDERAVRVQAIAASNDRMAFGAIEVLQQRGIQVPDSIAVTGFDDVSESKSMGVPLTTVNQPFFETGKRAFDALLKSMNGEKVNDVNVMPAQLVVRWSCGCLPENVKRAVVLPKEVSHTGRLENKRDAAIRALFSAAGIPEDSPERAQYIDVFGRTWDIFLVSLRELDKSDSFLKMIQTTVELLQRSNYDSTTWHNVISIFRRYALGGITSNTTMLRAENLFQQARMLVGELSQRAQAFRRLQFEQQEEALNHFSFSMAPAMTLEEIGDALSKHFPVLGLNRWYLMFYSDFASPGSVLSPTPESYRLLLQYDQDKFQIPQEKSAIATGRLVPRGKTPEDHRYAAVVMPLALASNRFGFMWAEMGPTDWDIYMRLKNLLSSALLRTMLVQQREQAQQEVERLLSEARERAVELARARDAAEKAASQNAKLFESEQIRRRGAEALARSSRQLSSLTTIEKLPHQILEQLQQVLPYDRGILLMEDVNGVPRIRSHQGLPADQDVSDFNIQLDGKDFYKTIARKGETLLVHNVDAVKDWRQPSWLPRDHSWMGVPLYSKDKVIGLLMLSRTHSGFNEDDGLMAATFAMQAIVALENARLYDEVTSINQMMERMVSQRVEELNNAYNTLAKHDKNKSAFIQVAAHELRTPLTVIKGYLGMLSVDPVVQANNVLSQAIEGVSQGTNRLHQVVSSMLDVARLDNQITNPHVEPVSLNLLLRLIHKDYLKDLETRQLKFELDEAIKEIPPLLADPELLKKALDHVIVNAIKFTPDGGSITVSASVVEDARLGKQAEIRIKDTGIGIDAEHHKIIFEKLFQLGTVELHSSSRTNYKGGGAGLGLAIAAGIVKALQGNIWVESNGHDETNFPGSTFVIRLPLVK
ncbi:substrate-binding domain-containing protein [Candidatus Villigracilis affinis]|uniref:substrate-binding domain-containing protein n=1 Tax=Candidatus Villigracilis affinis TaxID=3140682 RepID=UPI002A1F859A|nr:substrate-binding domain-containing protein [Anaerolineales bacterium]